MATVEEILPPIRTPAWLGSGRGVGLQFTDLTTIQGEAAMMKKKAVKKAAKKKATKKKAAARKKAAAKKK
ncbi:MAG: hypothetical protein ONB48_01280 [candidate division KSB1 bacterium]|nr:hypothetical protein [candidate division KSB1 bacterium]MDZ7284287.1 hypothetical protein [candidate division KSB1 bacterium]MDZ7297317.1 hypothetical protein [candidate division KSB1 bacterium]MDZ7308385.1 hypothetical protein [candidate division KSB1 bacterium]MDZ7348184.1 hypothetical protein [candidate division KSB1 bacterium]